MVTCFGYAGEHPAMPFGGMELRMEPCQKLLKLPPKDKNGRRPAYNKRGFADTKFNETQLKFVARAKERAPLRIASGGGFQRQPMVLEIGMAYGDLALEIVKPDRKTNSPGAFYFGIDMERVHVDIAESRLSKAQVHSSQYQTLRAEFPIAADDLETRATLASEFQTFAITDIGMFSVAMYLDPEKLQQFMNWAFDLLPSGGRLYLTAISPYANLYPGYESTYLHRRDFLKDSFPGWIPDVRVPEMRPFLPNLEEYLLKYPTFFHLLEPKVLEQCGLAAGFVEIKAKYLRRLFPENLVYRGNDPSVGELSSFIGVKP